MSTNTDIDSVPASTVVDPEAIEQNSERTRPDNVPEKFWDAEAGTIRTDSLLRSYVELERHLGKVLPMPSDDDPRSIERIQAALGRPETPEGYDIDAEALGLEIDSELNARLFDAGFTQTQAELVYQLAAERLSPLVENLASAAAFAQQKQRLEAHFGGPDRWKEVSRQLASWGEKQFGPEALEAIASTYNGVQALYEMMRASEPSMVGDSQEDAVPLSLDQLNNMVADPRYWRERDPDFIKRVSDGFTKLYPD